MTRLLATLVLVFAVAAPASAHEYGYGSSSTQKFGAIALSPTTGNLGWANGQRSQEAAEEAAASACGPADCTPVITEQNACAALATSDSGAAGWAWNADLATAQATATIQCESAGGVGCHVARWICD